MTDKAKLPPVESSPGKSQPLARGTSENRRNDNNSPGKVGKLTRMLSVFASGISLNTFEARDVGDTCLHTSISDLQRRYGITFTRVWEKVRNRFGGQTRVLRYSLTGDDLQKAQAVIDGVPATLLSPDAAVGQDSPQKRQSGIAGTAR